MLAHIGRHKFWYSVVVLIVLAFMLGFVPGFIVKVVSIKHAKKGSVKKQV